MFAVIIAYPIMDAVLMVPAIVILLNFRKEPLWFTPWICESLGLFLIAISDSWFAVVVLTSIVEQFWLSLASGTDWGPILRRKSWLSYEYVRLFQQ
jgi:hypothetical protein